MAQAKVRKCGALPQDLASHFFALAQKNGDKVYSACKAPAPYRITHHL